MTEAMAIEMLATFRNALIARFERELKLTRLQAIEIINANKTLFAAEFQKALDKIAVENAQKALH
jgi:hypothetical protein